MQRVSATLVAGLSILASLLTLAAQQPASPPPPQLNGLEYFAMPGVNVMAFQDIYAEGQVATAEANRRGIPGLLEPSVGRRK